jgi:hypothetical protein
VTDSRADSDDPREQARAALEAALAAAARRALAEGVEPEALIHYAEDRMAALRRSATDADATDADATDADTTDVELDGSAVPGERPAEDVPDRLDESS